MAEGRRHSKHFLAREPDGSARLRIRFTGEEAALFEEAAGDTPIMLWMHRTLNRAAREEVRRARQEQAAVPPPPLEE